ncbi:TetR/AcrR family transcriptional regulator [Streptomyces sp. NPDC060194]|uniref:TetR/AcrR family transcriptional regulator n=1 Tax=Streptomyces sp. NPDC060194 TaxID=3347069 RepID=UPI00364D3786
MVRMSAEERRESVVRAAMIEFARGGYHGTSTEAIAKRVGVSQPYLFRLFPDKRAIFLAAAVRCADETARVMVEAARNRSAGTAFEACGEAYRELLEHNPDMLLMQMQTNVAVASAAAAGDVAFGDPIRASWERLWDAIHEALGGEQGETTTFMAYGMLINVLASLGFPSGHRLWAGFEHTQPPGA